MNYDQKMTPYAEQFYRKLKTIIDQPGIPVSVSENAVVAIGRLGVHSSSVLSPYLGDFVEQFLHIIEPIEQTDERAHAFLGLNMMIKLNPYVMGEYLMQYIRASLAYNKDFVGEVDRGDNIGASFQQVSR